MKNDPAPGNSHRSRGRVAVAAACRGKSKKTYLAEQQQRLTGAARLGRKRKASEGPRGRRLAFATTEVTTRLSGGRARPRHHLRHPAPRVCPLLRDPVASTPAVSVTLRSVALCYNLISSRLVAHAKTENSCRLLLQRVRLHARQRHTGTAAGSLRPCSAGKLAHSQRRQARYRGDAGVQIINIITGWK